MRLEIDARARALLRRVPLRTAYTAIELVLMAVLAMQAARLVWAVATPVAPLGNWRLSRIGGGGAPGEMLRSFDPFFRLQATTASAGPSVVTPLQLVLYGIRLDGASGRGSAIIATPDGMQKNYAVGEEIMPGVTLKQVAFDHVTLGRGGADEDLFIDQSGGATPAQSASAPAADTSMSLAPGAGAGQAITLQQLKAEIGFIPRIDNGRITGLVVRPQGSGSVFSRVGLKEGDIVTQIGGRPVTGQGDIDGLAAQFANGGNISLTVERGAEVLPLVIAVSGK
ncbi:MAG: type II secretory protein PulC [Sphingomonas sp. 28-66-16]|nr:MAG: type II secretory protein PulC [Sphingomonas sp. 28-66-16]